MKSPETKQKIKDSVKQTKEKRKTQQIFTRELKINSSKLNSCSRSYFDQIFDETKWIKNNAMHNGIFIQPHNLKSVPVRYINENSALVEEQRQLNVLPTQSQMYAINELKQAVKSLATKKKKNAKIGPVQFIKEVDSVHYLQLNTTYQLKYNEKQILTHIKLAKNKQWIKVTGGEQLLGIDEIIGLKLVRKPSGLYIHVICAIAKTRFAEWKASFSKTVIPNKLPVVGCDLGIKTTIAISDNQVPQNREELNINFEITNQIKKIQRQLAKLLIKIKQMPEYKLNPKYRTKNYIKLIKKYRLAHEKLTNKRKTKAKQIVSYLTRRYEVIAFQDEMITGWAKGLFGKAVQFSALGTIKSELKKLIPYNRAVMIPKSVATTQLCPVCNEKTKHSLDKRIYRCNFCGFEDHRDYKSADMMYISAGLI